MFYLFITLLFKLTLFKADMNSDILLQTAAIFFLTNLYLSETGCWLGVCHGLLIRMGFL